MDRRKRKTVAQTWRPVCTQSKPTEDLIGNERYTFGGQVQEVQCTVSSYKSTVLADNSEAKVVDELIDSSHCPKAIQVSEGIDIEGQIAPSAVDKPISVAQKHSVVVEVGASLMRFIKGKGGATQRKIEEEMGVKIILPSSRKEDCLIIEGNSAESVAKASEKVQSVIDEVVKSPSLDYSHFVSLPLAIYPELVEKLINFQNTVLGITEVNQDEILERDSNDLGIEKSIFIKQKTFHLTVLMLKLWNKDRIEAATEVLRSVSPKVIDALESRPVSIRLKGLECMRGSLAKARVVYAPVEVIGGEDRLLHACRVINDAFTEAGLVLEKDANQKLKLHATIMNARHMRSKRRSRKVDSFDARTIFAQYGSEEWGEYLIREAHLSQRFVFDDSGYYHCCASIPFPEETQLG